MRKLRVLTIEDDLSTQELYYAQMASVVDLTQATTIEEAAVALESGTFDVVCFDGVLPLSATDASRSVERTVSLVAQAQRGRHVHLIAASDHEAYREALLKAGCWIAAFAKSELHHLVKSIAAAVPERELAVN